MVKIYRKYSSYYGVETTDYFCPKCGVKDVYRDIGEGDYYSGPDHICKSCKSVFHLPHGVSIDDRIIFREDEMKES